MRESARGGLGAFALKDLEFGDTILLEKPIIHTDTMNLFRDFRKLNDVAKTAFLGLHPFHPNRNASRIQKILNANA